MSEILETIKIKSTDEKSQGKFVEINKADFDKKKHVIYETIVGTPAPYVPPVETEEAFASDEASKSAEEAGLDIKEIKGTGKNGKINVGDVKAAVKAILDDDFEK